MGLKYYLNLFKKDTNSETVKLRYFLNTFIFMLSMIFLIAFYSLREKHFAASAVFGGLALIVLVISRILSNTSFEKLITKLMENEFMDPNDPVDAAFISYRKGYLEFQAKTRAADKKLFLINIIVPAMIFGFIPLQIILDYLGHYELVNKINTIINIAVFAYFIILIIVSIFTSKKILWYLDYNKEIDIINRYKAPISGGRKYKILEDKKPEKQMYYLFPDPILREKYLKKQKKMTRLSIILGIIFGISFVVIPSESIKNKLLASVLNSLDGIIIILFISYMIYIGIMQWKYIKNQYARLKENPSQFELNIRLHELRTPFMKRWNRLFPICLVAAIISNIILGGIVMNITGNDNFGLLFLLIFIMEFISTYVVYFKSFGKLRFRMIDIENEIDRQEMENTRLLAAAQSFSAKFEDKQF